MFLDTFQGGLSHWSHTLRTLRIPWTQACPTMSHPKQLPQWKKGPIEPLNISWGSAFMCSKHLLNRYSDDIGCIGSRKILNTEDSWKLIVISKRKGKLHYATWLSIFGDVHLRLYSIYLNIMCIFLFLYRPCSSISTQKLRVRTNFRNPHAKWPTWRAVVSRWSCMVKFKIWRSKLIKAASWYHGGSFQENFAARNPSRCM